MTNDTVNVTGLLLLLAALLGFIALAFPDPTASGAIPAPLAGDRIVCDADAAQDPVTEAGQYGRVWRQTCHIGTVDGPAVSVFFVD